MAGPTLGTAYVQVIPSAKGISGTLSEAMGGEAASAGADAGKSFAGNLKGFLLKAGIGNVQSGNGRRRETTTIISRRP